MVRSFALLVLVVAGLMTQLAASAQSPAGEVRLLASGSNCADCIWLQLTGPVDEQTEEALRDALFQFGFVNEVHLDSGGGDLQAALRLGVLFRELKIRTVVAGAKPELEAGRDGLASVTKGDCLSACVYLLAGGIERLSVADSRIGVHRFRLAADEPADDPLSLGQTQTGQLVAYLRMMSVDPILVSYSSMIASGEMGLVDPGTALETSLLTRKPINVSELAETSSGGISPSSFDPFGDEVRIPPTSRSVCNAPRAPTGERLRPYDEQQTIVVNRFWRTVCNLYFDGPRTQERWDVIYEAMQDPPTFAQVSSLAESSVRAGLSLAEMRARR
ncbi:hypothetical protein [Hyphomonas oceanitis]|uniref:COG3904 family protein n=1 Tax=Hyphomonas oceanitis TaxID=81033 RepID=UPI0012EBA010|nr:hypothetical protein [Hyphomonas oceanitis]